MKVYIRCVRRKKSQTGLRTEWKGERKRKYAYKTEKNIDGWRKVSVGVSSVKTKLRKCQTQKHSLGSITPHKAQQRTGARMIRQHVNIPLVDWKAGVSRRPLVGRSEEGENLTKVLLLFHGSTTATTYFIAYCHHFVWLWCLLLPVQILLKLLLLSQIFLPCCYCCWFHCLCCFR